MCVCVCINMEKTSLEMFSQLQKKNQSTTTTKKSFLTYLSGLLYYAVWILDKKLLLV